MSRSGRRTGGWALVASVGALGAWALAGTGGDAPPEVRAAERRPPPTLVGTLALSHALGGVEAGFGSAWIEDRGRGRLLRIDPRHGRVVARIRVRDRVSVAAGAGAVWALERGRRGTPTRSRPLMRIDPATGRVTRVALGGAARAGLVAFGIVPDPAGVWIWGPRDLLRVDRRGGGVDRRVRVEADGEVTGAAVHRGTLVLGTADGRVLRYDVRTGDALGGVRTPLAITDVHAGTVGALLVSAHGELAAVEAATGRLRWRRRFGYRIGGTVIAAGVLWVQASPSGRPADVLVGLEPGSGRELTRIDLDVLGTVAMASIGGRLWLTSMAGRVVVIDP